MSAVGRLTGVGISGVQALLSGPVRQVSSPVADSSGTATPSASEVIQRAIVQWKSSDRLHLYLYGAPGRGEPDT
jgi:hypothetical protein